MRRRGGVRERGAPRRGVLRRRLLLSGLLLFALALAGRAFQIGVAQHVHWSGRAAEQHVEQMALPAPRGTIYDRDGVPLGASREVYSLAVAGREIEDRQALIRKLREHAGFTAAEAKFALREILLGIAPAAISPYVLRKVGQAAAHDLFLTGRTFDATEARALGLVNEVATADRLDAAVDAWTRRFLKAGPKAIAVAKALIDRVAGAPIEAVQEFQVITNNPSAEFGRNSGAMVSVITKGGTNNFSGSVFEFHRNQDLRARGFFENRAVPKPDFKRNDFGGSFGGPIKRDNAFFFFSTEIVREVTGTSSNVTVETQDLVNWVNANRPNSIARQLFTQYAPPMYPTSNLRDLGGPLPGANVWSTTPDGIPDVGTIGLTTSGPREGDQLNFRYDQVFRGGASRAELAYEGGGHLFGAVTLEQGCHDRLFVFADRLGKAHIG